MPAKNKNQRALEILDILKLEYPAVKPALEYSNPFQLVISTILSAQCTDARVNIVTKDLFKKYKKPQDYLDVLNEELENTNLFRLRSNYTGRSECCRKND